MNNGRAKATSVRVLFQIKHLSTAFTRHVFKPILKDLNLTPITPDSGLADSNTYDWLSAISIAD